MVASLSTSQNCTPNQKKNPVRSDEIKLKKKKGQKKWCIAIFSKIQLWMIASLAT
jgi:hypothetical protein